MACEHSARSSRQPASAAGRGWPAVWGPLALFAGSGRASTGAGSAVGSNLATGPLVSALGLWLSVVSVAVVLAWVSYRLGQARERQRLQTPQVLDRQTPAVAGAQVQRDPADQAEREQHRLHATLRQVQAEVLQAAALPLLLAQTGAPSLDSTAPGTPWVLALLNPAAAALWPDAQPGQPLGELLQRLPGPAGPGQHSPHPVDRADTNDDQDPGVASTGSLLSQALPKLAPGESAEQGGWRIARLATPALGQDTVLLAASGPGWAASAGQAPAVAPATVSPPPSAAPGTTVPQASDGMAGESENFSFTLSHDLRAPIRVVEGFTRIVKEDYGRLLDRVGNDHLDRVLGAAARMNLMIDALLTLARLSSQPLAQQPVNLSQLAHYVIDDLKRHHPDRASQVHIEPGLTAVGDPTLLRLVLENLLGNAWKYSGRSASTHIEFRREPVDGRPAFVVRDQGAGFDMRSADRLFGLFQRLHSANDFPGTGVGLASVRRIVRRHGGEIWAEAEPGRGASFHFTLSH